MTDKIEPALTPEEWADPERNVKREDGFFCYRPAGQMSIVVGFEGLPAVGIPEEAFNAVVAVLLDGQPFGFTRLSAPSIRHLIEHARKEAAKVGPMHALWDSIFQAEEDAARIAALLPPEGA